MLTHPGGVTQQTSPTTGVTTDPDGLAPLDLQQEPWPGHHEVLAGHEVHVRRTPGPDGVTPAVFVHGLGGSASNWTDLAGLLAPLAPGLALDLPGFGRSAPPPHGRYSLTGSADAVTALLETTGPAHLFGNSMGGAVSILVAARRPELVRTLTLISPAVPDLRPDPRRISDPRLPLAYFPVVGGFFRRRLQSSTPRERAGSTNHDWSSALKLRPSASAAHDCPPRSCASATACAIRCSGTRSGSAKHSRTSASARSRAVEDCS